MNAFNPAHFRAQFPALADAGVYLDSAATALKPQAVIDASDQFYRLSAGNVHRSQFAAAQRLTERYEAARERVAAWLNAPSGKDIVWTRGTTEAINMVAQSYVRPRLQPGDEIIVSEAEHHANLVPWLMVAGQTGARVVKLPLGADRLPDIASLSALITPRSRVLAIGQMSNVTGGCPDLAQAIRLAHAAGMVVMVDGAQGAVHFPADVQALDIDFYAFSGHKLYGPTGIGVLYGRSELLQAMAPWEGGGSMIATVSLTEGTTWNRAPWRFEAGTPNTGGIIGLGAALTYVSQLGLTQIAEYEQTLMRYALEALRAVPDLILYGPAQRKGVIAFNLGQHHAYDVGSFLDNYGIAVRTGHHCAMPLMARYQVPAMCRASLAMYNTTEEVDRLVAGLQRIHKLLG